MLYHHSHKNRTLQPVWKIANKPHKTQNWSPHFANTDQTAAKNFLNRKKSHQTHKCTDNLQYCHSNHFKCDRMLNTSQRKLKACHTILGQSLCYADK